MPIKVNRIAGLIVAPLVAAGLAEAAGLTVETSPSTVRVSAVEIPRRQLLAEIARQGGLRLLADDPLATTITVEFDHLPLALALRRILGSRGFVLEHKPGPDGRRRLWILAGSDARPSPIPHRAPPAERRQRLGAVSALAADGSEDSARVLAATALSDADPAVRREAVHALGELGGEARIDTLERALLDPDRGVRETAAAALADIGGERSARALSVVLDDTDPTVRERALDVLGEIGGPVAAALLRDALLDLDPVVREAAAENLAELPDG